MHDRRDLFKLCTIQCISRTFFFDVWFLSFHFESRTMLDWSTDAAKNGPVEISFTCYAVPGLARSRRSNCPNLSYKFQPAQKSTNCGTGELGIRMKLLNCPEIAKCGIYEKTPTRAAICPASHEACFWRGTYCLACHLIRLPGCFASQRTYRERLIERIDKHI